MKKIISLDEAMSFLCDGASVMIGGFACNGIPSKLIEALLYSKIKDITLISSDLGLDGIFGIGKLVENRKCKKVMASFIGSNKDIMQQINNKEIEINLIPQGTLAECIRAAGYGLGGVLTPTGIDTLSELGKQKVVVDGKEFLLEKPLHADVALIYAAISDRMGNLVYNGTERNFNHVMACAAKITIVQAEKIVEIGDINLNHINTPGIFVDYIVDGGYCN